MFLENIWEDLYEQSGTGIVNIFLEAIKTGDTLIFWGLLDKQGQGYFMGMWFFALGNSDLAGISMLAEDENFLRDALSGIVVDLKENLNAVLDNYQIGALKYIDSHHAEVPITVGGESGEEPVTEYVPLVLELAPAGVACEPKSSVEGNIGMTCWKIDALKCFRIQKT